MTPERASSVIRQMEKQVVPLEVKEGWIRRAMAAGVDIVQVGSFVHPEKVPQMADTDELFRRLTAGKSGGTVLSGLVCAPLAAAIHFHDFRGKSVLIFEIKFSGQCKFL